MKLRLWLALALTFAVLPARADTYKWIDGKGQVNYSNAPPPSALELIQLVEERISVSGADPATRDALARMEARLEERRQYEVQDWLQRQRAMVMQGAPHADCGYGGYCGDGYAPSYYSSPQFLPAYYSPYSQRGRVFTAAVPRHMHAQTHAHVSHARSHSPAQPRSQPRSHSQSRGSARR